MVIGVFKGQNVDWDLEYIPSLLSFTMGCNKYMFMPDGGSLYDGPYDDEFKAWMIKHKEELNKVLWDWKTHEEYEGPDTLIKD